MKNVITYAKAQEELHAALDAFARPRDLIPAFSDLLEMLVCECTPHWTDQDTGQLRGRYTDKYLEVVKRYQPDHIREFYPAVCRSLFQAYDVGVTATGGWCDPLGEYFQAIASSRDKAWKGQFFTPQPVCDMMAKLTAGETTKQKGQKVLDPACGTGRMQLALDRQCPPGSFHLYIGVDVDQRCVRIAALNFFFHGLRGVVICGNSLSLKAQFGFRVYSPVMGMGIVHLSAEECMPYLAQAQNQQHEQPINADFGDQLTLF